MDPISICLFLFLPAFLYLQVRLEHSWAKAIFAKFQGILLARKESKVDCLHTRAISLVDKFSQEGGNNYIEEAIDLDREALMLCPPGYRMRPVSLTWLAYHLWHRHRQLGSATVLAEAISLAQEGLDSCPSEYPSRPMSLHTLAVCLFARYSKDGKVEDLHKSTVLNEEALKLRSPGHPDRWLSLNNLSVNLFTRYELLGVVGDLDAAIALDQEALAIYPQGHPNRISSLNSLAIHLSARHTQLHVIQDLERGIALVREALGYPRGNPLRSTSLNNLALLLHTRYNALKVMADLDEAIVLGQEALSLHPPGHPDRSKSLNNLATRFSTRYKQRRAVEDLNEAICLDKQALELRPPGDPLRYTSLNNLGLHLFARYEQLGEVEDIDEATILGRQALQLCPFGHPSRSRALQNLAGHLRSRFIRSGLVEDKEALFDVCTELVGVSQVVSYMDLHAARTWTHMAEELQHPSAILAYETSFRFLTRHVTTLPSSTQHLGILKNFTSSLAVDAFSACLRSHLPERAVELLEQGRGVFWSQITRLRSPLDDVVASGPKGEKLAREFEQLSSLVRDILNSRSTDQHDCLCHLSIELQRVESLIRELPGLEHFLLPPRFSDLQRSASGGPIIIVNGSRYSCDALIVIIDRDPVHLPLQISQEDVRALSAELRTITERAKKVDDVTKELAFLLRKLWDCIVSPIVDLLQTIHPTPSRIWWCPTSDFSFLPLHAAGPNRKGQRNLSNLYVSSYTPSLSALIRARHCGTSNSESASGKKGFIAIGQAKTSGERELPELPSVDSELTYIGQRVGGLAAFTRLEGPEACISRVAEEMRKNQWVHLACHGIPNPKAPFQSAFALHDGPFTIERIIQCKLENPEFAYLSACHTTVGYDESPDEAIHLASAMQFAGFRSVVGTMWAVADGETCKVTSTFYKHMVDESGRLDYTRAAFALNKTMKSVNIAFDQRILYIHIGA